MKRGFYFRLAQIGMARNSSIYNPCFVTGIGVVAIYTIVAFLQHNPMVAASKGGAFVEWILATGRIIIGVFSLLFLWYVNGFIQSRRNRELGLYHVLGTPKKGLLKIVAAETLMLGLVTIGVGMAAGIALSKMAELLLAYLLGISRDFVFRFSLQGAIETLVTYLGIYFLLFLGNLWNLWRSNPLELLRSESVGEKPPRANWLLGTVGLALLVWAYYMALRPANTIQAMESFMKAVLLVVIATYLLFTAGSVALCRLLQRNKRYYNHKKHFVSVSNMTYRMKRNGLGLASVCILCTMVLVMFASTTSLYAGAGDSISQGYPRTAELTAKVDDTAALTLKNAQLFRWKLETSLAEYGIDQQDPLSYRYGFTYGTVENGWMETDPSSATSAMKADVMGAIFIPLEDYNALTGENLTLQPGQVCIVGQRQEYQDAVFQLKDTQPLEVVKAPARYAALCGPWSNIAAQIPIYQVVLPDFEAYMAQAVPASGQMNEKEPYLRTGFVYAFEGATREQWDTWASQEKEGLTQWMAQQGLAQELSLIFNSREELWEDYYSIYGTLTFIGILLSGVFLMAAALIIYYKQIGEGWEDQARYEILQKVGMTRREIKASIRSQILTVFFAPIGMAVCHLAFATPIIMRMMRVFNMVNDALTIRVICIVVLVFSLGYALVYSFTSRAYYRLVTDGR